jgi:hypothetical protein
VLLGARAVPIRPFLGSEGAFGPDDLKAMGEAFSSALARLGLYDKSDPSVELVARSIVRAALDGERDPARLCEIAVRGVGGGRAA